MTGGQIAGLGCGILLLLPGACFVAVSISPGDANGLGIGLFILLVAAALIFAAFGRRDRPRRGSAPPPGDSP